MEIDGDKYFTPAALLAMAKAALLVEFAEEQRDMVENLRGQMIPSAHSERAKLLRRALHYLKKACLAPADFRVSPAVQRQPTSDAKGRVGNFEHPRLQITFEQGKAPVVKKTVRSTASGKPRVPMVIN
jgi:hypothetical protein